MCCVYTRTYVRICVDHCTVSDTTLPGNQDRVTLKKHCCTRGGQFECKTLLLWQSSRCRVLDSRSCPYLLRCKRPPGCGCLAAMGHLAACDLGGGVERCGMHQLKVSVVQCQMAMGRTVCTNLANFYLWWFREV